MLRLILLLLLPRGEETTTQMKYKLFREMATSDRWLTTLDYTKDQATLHHRLDYYITSSIGMPYSNSLYSLCGESRTLIL